MNDDRDRRYVYGVNPVLEALRSHPGDIERLFVAQGDVERGPAAEIFSRARELHVPVQKVPREKLSTLADGGVHQGVVAELRSFAYTELEDLVEHSKGFGNRALLVVLDGVQDPQNFGAIVRSAHAFGSQGVVIPKDRAAQVTGVVSKASAGAIEHTRIARVVNLSRALETLKDAGFWTAVADPEGTQLPWEVSWTGPIALVVGAEGAGVRPGVIKHCDHRVKIPLLGKVASLNASVATGALLYEIHRGRSLSERSTGAR